MNNLLLALINTLRYAATFGDNQDALTIIPPKQIITHLFSGLLPQPQIDQIAGTLLAVADGSATSLAGLQMIESHVAQQGDLEARLSAANQALSELMAIRDAIFSALTNHADVIIDDVNVLGYIQKLYLDSQRGQPDFVLIGAIPSEQPRLQVRLDDNKALLRKIDILYVSDTYYPLLNVRVASNSAISQWTSDRKNWQQKANPDDDLRLSMRSTMLGKIRTRSVELPFSVSGKKIRLTIQNIPDVTFLVTTVLDEKDNPLVTCLKLGSV